MEATRCFFCAMKQEGIISAINHEKNIQFYTLFIDIHVHDTTF